MKTLLLKINETKIILLSTNQDIIKDFQYATQFIALSYKAIYSATTQFALELVRYNSVLHNVHNI